MQSEMNTAVCPHCKYDLRSQIGTGASVVECPECGRGWVTKDLFAPKPRVHSKALFLFVSFLGLPILVIALAIVLGGNGILVFVVYPGLFAVIGAVHLLITLAMAVRLGFRGSPRFARVVTTCVFFYDATIILFLVALASSPMGC